MVTIFFVVSGYSLSVKVLRHMLADEWDMSPSNPFIIRFPMRAEIIFTQHDILILRSGLYAVWLVQFPV
jgi:hypothetical protein